MKPKLLPTPFFIALVGGLVALSWLGSVVHNKPLIDRFVRFHMLHNVEAGFFPTSRQVKDIVDKTEGEEGLIYVIVGGSSVFHGVGQPPPHIWTQTLQELLGAKYRVINFAQRGGGPHDFGNVAAEYLLQKSRRVIYLADASRLNFAISLESSAYSHIIFDAWHRGMLLPWAPRDKLLSNAPFSSANPKLKNRALEEELDTYLNFNDLWGYVAFRYANLIWNNVLAEESYEALAKIQDPERSPEYLDLSQYAGDTSLTMRIIRSQAQSFGEATWRANLEQTEMQIPPQLRAVTLCVVDLESPFYRSRMLTEEQDAYLATVRKNAALLHGIGIYKTVIGMDGFSDQDYIDRVHLSPLGATKLAAALALQVAEMAASLGYLQ